MVTEDFRRHVRPFFLTRDGTQPTKYKVFYDIFSYLITQTVFCFTTAPFVLLTLHDSLLVWSRVHFFAIVGVTLSMAFFASPGKLWLDRRLQQRNRSEIKYSSSQESLNHTTTGPPSDSVRDVNKASREVRKEIKMRGRQGSTITMPQTKI